jgi:hypothetical protein
MESNPGPAFTVIGNSLSRARLLVQELRCLGVLWATNEKITLDSIRENSKCLCYNSSAEFMLTESHLAIKKSCVSHSDFIEHVKKCIEWKRQVLEVKND